MCQCKWSSEEEAQEEGGMIYQDVRTDMVIATKSKAKQNKKTKMKGRKKMATCLRDKRAWVEHLNC